MSKNSSFFVGEKPLKPIYSNRIYNCCLFDSLDVIDMIGDNAVDLIISDFQNVLTNKYEVLDMSYNKLITYSNIDDTEQKEQRFKQLTESLNDLCRILSKRGKMYLFIDRHYTSKFYEFATRIGFKTVKIINEDNVTLDTYSNRYDLLCLSCDDVKDTNNDTPTDDKIINQISTEINLDQEPLEVLRQIIKSNSKARDIVLNPFATNELVGVVCFETSRGYIGCESNYGYLKKIKENLQNVIEPHNYENYIFKKYKCKN